MKHFLFFILLYVLAEYKIFGQSKLQVSYDIYPYYFYQNHSNKDCFVEVALTYGPGYLNFQKTSDQKFFVQLKTYVNIFENNRLIKTDSFFVKKTSIAGPDSFPYFAYIKRYWLKNHHDYMFSIHVKDFYGKDTSMNFHAQKKISINFSDDKISSSDIQFIEFIEKSDNKNDMFYKYGYAIVPYNDNYFNEDFNEIKFLMEIYNADTVLTKNEPYVIKYYLKDKDNDKVLETYGGFQKKTSAKITPFIASIGINKLPSGNYDLIVEGFDKNNRLLFSKSKYFQRKNTNVVKTLSLNDEIFFGNQTNIDTLKMWVEALWPIANNLEKDWIINQSVKKDPTLMKNFMIDFWDKRASDTASAVEMAKRYYSNLNIVMKNFKCGKIAPYYTDRGRVYLQYGAPNQRSIQLSEPGAYPYEIWQYYRIYDPATHQFFTNKKFVFVNKGIADDCYSLIHSDMKGELSNPNWQNEIMKHDPYNPNNPYQQQQMNYGNNFNKLYQNPQ